MDRGGVGEGGRCCWSDTDDGSDDKLRVPYALTTVDGRVHTQGFVVDVRVQFVNATKGGLY